MDVAVVGASGSVGRAVCGQLLATGTLGPGERLQLVGRSGSASETGVFGLAIDLRDAYVDSAPTIEPILELERIAADVVVMVAGQTPSDKPADFTSRDAVAKVNLPLFESVAEVLATHGTGREIVVIQSNPVELAVDVFARRLGPNRVIGAGSFNDSQRLRREVAEGFTRSPWYRGRKPLVVGYMLGEHGPAAVPMWSTLRAQGVDLQSWAQYLAAARGGRRFDELPGEVVQARDRVAAMLVEHQGEEAFTYIDGLPPDVRSLVKPWYAHWSGRTSTATAHCVVDIIQELGQGHRVLLPLQVACSADDWPGRAGVVGLVVDVDHEGWHRSIPLDVPDDEHQALLDAIGAIGQRLAQWRGD